MSQQTNNHAIQVALRKRGFDPGPPDGVIGPNTKKAIKLFQESVGIPADGVVGPQTISALNPFEVEGLENIVHIPWLRVSLSLLGVKQFSGGASNPAIDGRDGVLEVDYNSDETAWCGLHVGYCIKQALSEEPLPENLLGARNWLGFGEEADAKMGSILVFWRESPSSWKGHVGFYYGETEKDYLVLGGNQSDSVSIAKYSKSRLLGARWPVST